MTDLPTNPYQAPLADLNARPIPTGQTGSIEDAIAGRYDFDIGDVMREAWWLTRGMKASFWAAAALIYAVMFMALFIGSAIASKSPTLGMVMNALVGLAAPALFIGLVAIGIRRAAGLPVSFSTAFSCFDRTVPALLAGVLTTLLTYVGIFLLVIPGIYLAIAYCMTMPLIADRNLGPWQAMEISRKAVTKRWFQFFGLLFLVGLLVGASALPLGIPLIWTMPWAINVLGVVYRRTFGVAQTA